MRDRLIELTKASLMRHIDKSCKLAENIADDLLAEGVIVPPCKAGDTVYVLTFASPTGIEKSRAKRLQIIERDDGTTVKIIVPCVFDDWGDAFRVFFPEDFGKTVFLTREQAEKALAEVAKDNTDIAFRWEKNMEHLQSGGFGPVEQPQTLLLYWKTQERAGYPYASENVKYFEEMVEKENR